MPANKVIIGNEEWCAFPGLAIPAIKARVDSGAKTSALHALNIECFQRDNADWVKFDIHPLQNNRIIVVHCEAQVCDRRWVKSSSGLSEKRYVIKVPLQLGNFLWQVEITLTNRDSMGYRMLLGRNAMQDHVLVDPAQGCYLGEKSRADIAALYAITPSTATGLLIGVLGCKADSYGNQSLLECAKQHGHRVVFIDIQNSSLQFSGIGAQCWQDNVPIPVPDLIIPRIPASQSHYGCALLQHFQLQGAATMNSANAIRQARDCISILHIMQQMHIPVLAHRFFHCREPAAPIIRQIGGLPVLINTFQPDIAKPFRIATTLAEADAIISEANSPVVLQEYVSLMNLPIIRSVVLHDKVLAAREKPLKINGLDIQHKLAQQVILNEEEQMLVVRAAQAMNLVLAGIDIVRTERGPVFFGLTPNPGLAHNTASVSVNQIGNSGVAQCIIRDIEEKFQHKVKQHA